VLLERRLCISEESRGKDKGDKCYILILPLLFLILLHLFIHLPTKHLIPGTVLLLSLTSLTLFPLISLTSSPALPQNPLVLLPYYALGHIPLTTSLSSTPIILMGTPQCLGSCLVLIRLMSIPWSTPPFATSVSVPLIALTVVTNELSSYLLIFSLLSLWISYRSLLIAPFMFQLLLARYCSLASCCLLMFQLTL
jgi:hypothetical protein